jgi:hypothetical protein
MRMMVDRRNKRLNIAFCWEGEVEMDGHDIMFDLEMEDIEVYSLEGNDEPVPLLSKDEQRYIMGLMEDAIIDDAEENRRGLSDWRRDE